MDLDWNATLALLFGSGGIGVWAVKYFFEHQHAKKNRKVQQSYARIYEIFKVLQITRIATRATRVCVLKTENGGGIPAPGCDVKSSVMYEDADPTMTRELASSWQKVALNGVWAEILKKLSVDRHFRLTPDPNMGPHFNFLAESDCVCVQFVLINLTETAMFYLSVHLGPGVDLTPNELSVIHASARQIHQLFQDNYELTEGV